MVCMKRLREGSKQLVRGRAEVKIGYILRFTKLYS